MTTAASGYVARIEPFDHLLDQMDVVWLRQFLAAQDVLDNQPVQQADAQAAPGLAVFLGHLGHPRVAGFGDGGDQPAAVLLRIQSDRALLVARLDVFPNRNGCVGSLAGGPGREERLEPGRKLVGAK